ncbi:MAG: hypothetical protein IIZ61_06720 [Lachnospiraceae bacterium]|nr:hypothetical protein [Lachnospiraceae bacterium]
MLTVLKIIGIVLACIIGLVLLLICLVLFVPVRYRINAEKADPEADPVAFAHASFILHILSAKVIYEKKLEIIVRIFGFRLFQDRKSEKKRRKRKKASEDKKEEYSLDWNEPDDDHRPDEEETDDKADGIKTEEDKIENAKSEDNKGKDDKSEEGSYEKVEKILNDLSDKYLEYSDKIDRIRREIRFWDRMINDCRNKNAAELIKKETLKLLKKIAPRRIKGFIHFGFDDPATTGTVLMYLSLIYPILPRKLVIDPGFEDTDLYGNIDIKGYIRLIVPLVCVAKVYFNRDFKRMWRIYKKHSNR